ncbi:MAG: HesB-like protein [Bacillota bacterium]|nr:HesB-like protein [Bacillota bacterium]
MATINISDSAYDKFKAFLESANINSNTLRIYLENSGCSGPIFNIMVDERTMNDIFHQVKDLNFIMDGMLFRQFRGVTITSPEENGTDDFAITPNVEVDGCSGCSGCH